MILSLEHLVGTEPPADLNASADYKAHLVEVLVKRCLAEAVAP